jgi:hypothetical protein
MLVGMRLTARQLNRATLQRQMLLQRAPLGVAPALQQLVALQAQSAPSPYLALWNRVDGFDAATLDAAFADRTVVKASLLRMTLHAVHADDYPIIHRAMLNNLRASRLYDARFKATGLSVADAEALMSALTAFVAEPRTSAELETKVAGLLGSTTERVWWALKMYFPFHHAPTGGPWSFGARASFVAAPAVSGPASEEAAVPQLLLRYLGAFGPASAADFAQFTMLRMPVVHAAVAALGDQITPLDGPGRVQLLDVRGAQTPAGDEPAPPRLLGMWDNTLLAYADRSRIIPEAYRSTVIRRNGDVLPTLLLDGEVAGVWRTVDGAVEVTAFRSMSKAAWKGIAEEAGALHSFLAPRDLRVYNRYAHWWDKGVPAAETRTSPTSVARRWSSASTTKTMAPPGSIRADTSSSPTAPDTRRSSLHHGEMAPMDASAPVMSAHESDDPAVAPAWAAEFAVLLYATPTRRRARSRTSTACWKTTCSQLSAK